jgi:Na+-transporting NADH:ubiquinone oxidoreductase subunit F
MTPWMRRLHKWVGLLIALQFVLWMASGLTMSLLDHDAVGGHGRGHSPAAPARWPTGLRTPAAVLASTPRPIISLESTWLLERPVYRIVGEAGRRLVDAATGETVEIDATRVAALAGADYGSREHMAPPRLLEGPSLEARGHEGPIWRVDFHDKDDTTLYISGWDGQILDRRNATWRLFDIAWMLHIMDYSGRADFNNALVVMSASCGLWMALSGLWLLAVTLSPAEFVPRRCRRKASLRLFDASEQPLRTLEVAAGEHVFEALARAGMKLPSNCGGGQSCGLCQVRLLGAPPPATDSDRALVRPARLQQGYRLACGLGAQAGLQIALPEGLHGHGDFEATVEQVNALTPFLREITLRADGATFDAPAGAYVQVHVPAYEMCRTRMGYPEAHRADWDALGLLPVLVNAAEVRRAYSLALPPAIREGRVVLLARLYAAPAGGEATPSGRGSSYLYSLQVGDRVRLSGPFGQFALRPGAREKVFIGGGAGMAPLRAMIHARLKQGAAEPIHFWYGARSLRDAPYVSEMEQLARQYPNFRWHLVLSEGQADLESGSPRPVHVAAHDGLLREHPSLEQCEFYLCGPPAMLRATRRMLDELGVPEDNVDFDDFMI